jgi:hypothetical protein
LAGCCACNSVRHQAFDRLIKDAGIDVLQAATSKHNIRYLLCGHRAFLFDYNAMGLSRYLPILVYAMGAPVTAAFFGHRLENFQREVAPLDHDRGDRRPWSFTK